MESKIIQEPVTRYVRFKKTPSGNKPELNLNDFKEPLKLEYGTSNNHEIAHALLVSIFERMGGYKTNCLSVLNEAITEGLFHGLFGEISYNSTNKYTPITEEVMLTSINRDMAFLMAHMSSRDTGIDHDTERRRLLTILRDEKDESKHQFILECQKFDPNFLQNREALKQIVVKTKEWATATYNENPSFYNYLRRLYKLSMIWSYCVDLDGLNENSTIEEIQKIEDKEINVLFKKVNNLIGSKVFSQKTTNLNEFIEELTNCSEMIEKDKLLKLKIENYIKDFFGGSEFLIDISNRDMLYEGLFTIITGKEIDNERHFEISYTEEESESEVNSPEIQQINELCANLPDLYKQ
jgi:hypothetical protein